MPNPSPPATILIVAACLFVARLRIGARESSRRPNQRTWPHQRFPALIFITGLLLWLAACPARAAEPIPYRVDSWKTDEGLPQSSVTSIIQSREGYLWLGTFGGLARFDGVRFITFNPKNSPKLPSGRVLSVFQDQQGNLWAGTEEGSLACFSGGEISSFNPPNRGSTSRYIRSIAESSDGSLWLHSAEDQLIRRAGGQFSVCSSNWNLAGREAHAIVTDAGGRLWVGTDQELATWENGAFKTRWSQAQEANFHVDGLASGSNGIWVAANGKLRRFLHGKWVADFGSYPWSKGILMCLTEDRRGRLWAGTYGSGLFRFETNGTVLQISRAEGLPANIVRSLREDREGNLWVGTEGHGLARLKPSIFRSFGREQGLSSDLVLSVSEGKEGELWIGTNGEGVDRLKNGKVRHFGPQEGLVNECVWSVLEDRHKTLWAGTWGGGLFRLEQDKFVPYVSPECGQIVCALYEDSRNNLWLGQLLSEPQVTRLSDGKAVQFPIQTLSGGVDARVVTEDASGHIWVGTRGDGLYRLKQGECTRFTHQDGLNSDVILSLYNDADGVLWVGTGSGLNRMQGSRFTSLTTQDGLVDDVICFMTEDDHGQFWFGSGGGVFRVEKAELNRYAAGASEKLRCFGYTKADGLPSLECSSGCQPAGCKTKDGRLWFPTVNGLAMVDPQSIPFNPLPPPVVIEGVAIEGELRNTLEVPGAIDIPANRSAEPPALDPHALTVPPGKQRFEFHFTGLSFTAPEKVRFKYRLDGLEKEWVEAGSQRSAFYSFLQPRRYVFRVLACNNDGVWNESGAALALIVLPHFWQTWWFRGVVIATGLLLLAAAYELRLASERRLNRLRLRIARDLHDEVGSNLGSIALLSEVMPRSSTGSPEEFSEIRRIAVQTIDSLRDIVWFLDPAGDNLGELILRMKEVSRTMLPGMAIDFQATGEHIAVAPSLEFRRNIFPIFKEILHNIGKHAHAQKVQIAISAGQREFQLRIQDDGVGFNEATVRKGNGLKNLRRRAGDLNGKISIQSEPGAGTTVTLFSRLP